MSLQNAIDCIKSGKVLLTNTDTIPGLSCDARNSEAIQRIVEIKNRQKEKLHFVVLVSSDMVLNKCIEEVPEMGWELIDCADTPLTIVFDGAKYVSPECIAEDGTLAIRYIKNGELKTLLDKLKMPIVSTSANISGQKNPTKLAEVNTDIQSKVDFIWQSETPSSGQASTIMKLKANGEFTFIRK